MTRYPMFFKHGGLVAGRGFIAHVGIHGRCLLEHTAEDFWSFLGVNPGGIAGDGPTCAEAHRDFLDRVKLVVFDIAEEATDFENFRQSVARFFGETNQSVEADWQAAVARVRSGELDLAGCRRVNATETPIGVEVELVAAQAANDLVDSRTQLRPGLNEAAVDEPIRMAVGF